MSHANHPNERLVASAIASASRTRARTLIWRHVARSALLLALVCFALPATAAGASSSRATGQSGVTPLAPVCPNVAETEGLPVLSCFPPDNGNQSQSAAGAGEIAGATLSGPKVLVAGKCPGSTYIATSGNYWCTPSFSLSLSVPGESSAKYVQAFTLDGFALPGTSVTTSAAKCTTCAAQELLGNFPAGVLGEGGAWCPKEFTVSPYNCPPWTKSTAPLLLR